jgi:hypothetical protein
VGGGVNKVLFDLAAKVFLMIAWPLIALLLLAMMVLVLVAAWLLIPFSVITCKGGHCSMKFPWSD